MFVISHLTATTVVYPNRRFFDQCRRSVSKIPMLPGLRRTIVQQAAPALLSQLPSPTMEHNVALYRAELGAQATKLASVKFSVLSELLLQYSMYWIIVLSRSVGIPPMFSSFHVQLRLRRPRYRPIPSFFPDRLGQFFQRNFQFGFKHEKMQGTTIFSINHILVRHFLVFTE